MFNALKERIVLILITIVLLPLFACGIVVMIVYIFVFGRNWILRQCFRTVDHFVNVTLFGGYAWESLSSHAWRERSNKFWAPFIICIADIFHKGHCRKANLREQEIIDIVKAKYLDEQTIKF